MPGLVILHVSGRPPQLLGFEVVAHAPHVGDGHPAADLLIAGAGQRAHLRGQTAIAGGEHVGNVLRRGVERNLRGIHPGVTNLTHQTHDSISLRTRRMFGANAAELNAPAVLIMEVAT